MVSANRSFRVAALSALLSVVGLATVLYHVSVYESPNDGGTSLVGIGFFFMLVLCAVSLAEAGFVAVLVRWGSVTVWPRRVLSAGAAGAGLAALSLTLSEIPDVTARTNPIGAALEPFSGSLFGAAWAFAALGLVGTLAGLATHLLGSLSGNE